jgi:lysophospholipase L1-like esterase
MSQNNKSQKIKIVFLGDSLTAGAGASAVEKTFPRLIASRLAENYQVELLNLGAPGATTKDVLLSQVAETNDFKPDKIVLFIGTNDIHQRTGVKETKADLEKILVDLKIAKENLYIVNIPYLGTKQLFLPPLRSYFLLQTKRYNQIFSELKVEGWQVMDLYGQTLETFKNRTDVYSVDHFHPSDLGYQIFAEVIYKGMF